MRKLRRRGTGISAKGVCHAFGTSVPHRWHNRANRWHKCFRHVARLFPAYGTVGLSGRQGSYQCLLVSFTMHDMMIHNACYGHYQCMMWSDSRSISSTIRTFSVPLPQFQFGGAIPGSGVWKDRSVCAGCRPVCCCRRLACLDNLPFLRFVRQVGGW